MEYSLPETTIGVKCECVWNGIKPKKHQCQPKRLAFFLAAASDGQLCVEKNARAFYFYKAIERLYAGNFT